MAANNTIRVTDRVNAITWDRECDRFRVKTAGHRQSVYDRHRPPWTTSAGQQSV